MNFNGFYRVLECHDRESQKQVRDDSCSQFRRNKIVDFPFSGEYPTLCSSQESGMRWGGILFNTQQVCHSQYISANEYGKEFGALDAVFDNIINNLHPNFRYFDFGQSTEDYGKYLNEGLIYQKEGFGGRGVCYDCYEYEI